MKEEIKMHGVGEKKYVYSVETYGGDKSENRLALVTLTTITPDEMIELYMGEGWWIESGWDLYSKMDFRMVILNESCLDMTEDEVVRKVMMESFDPNLVPGWSLSVNIQAEEGFYWFEREFNPELEYYPNTPERVRNFQMRRDMGWEMDEWDDKDGEFDKENFAIEWERREQEREEREEKRRAESFRLQEEEAQRRALMTDEEKWDEVRKIKNMTECNMGCGMEKEKKKVVKKCKQNGAKDCESMVEILGQVISSGGVVEFMYKKPTDRVFEKRVVENIEIVNLKYGRKNTLCIRGHCRVRDAERTFALKRMDDLAIHL